MIKEKINKIDKEDHKGGVCSKCGMWKGGDCGINGNGVRSYHKCKTNKNIDEVLEEFDEKYYKKMLKEMPIKYHEGLILLFRNQKTFIKNKLHEAQERKVEEIRKSIYIKFGKHKKRKGDFLPLYLDEIAEILQYKSN